MSEDRYDCSDPDKIRNWIETLDLALTELYISVGKLSDRVTKLEGKK